MRRLLKIALALLLLFLLLVAGGALFLRTERGGELIRRGLVEGVGSLIAGSLEIGSVEFRGFDEIIARDVRLLDPDGEDAIEADELVVAIEPRALLRLELSFPEIVLRRGKLHLRDGEEGLPSFLDALASPEPSTDDSPSPITARAPKIRIEDLEVEGTVASVEGIHLEGATLEGSLEYVDDALTIRIDTLDGTLTGPVKAPIPLHAGAVVIDTRPEIGTSLSATLGEGDEQVRLDLRYASPEGTQDPEVVSAKVNVRGLRPATLSELGVDGLDVLEGEVRGELRVEGAPEALTLDGEIEHAAGRVSLEGKIDERVELRVRSEDLAVHRLVTGAPEVSASFDATLTLEDGKAPRVAIELAPLELSGVKVPATSSTLVLEEDRVVVSSRATSLESGALRVDGSVRHDGRLDLRVSADLPSVGKSEELRALLPGLGGGADVNARIQGTIDAPRVRGAIVLSPFVYGPVRAARLAIDGDVRELGASPSLSLELSASRVTIFDESVGDVALTLTGRRGALEAKGRFYGPSEGTIDARFDLGDVFQLHHAVIRSPRFHVDARDVTVSERETRLGSVHVRLGDGRLVLSGTILARGPDRLQLDVDDLLISDLRTFVELPFEALEGSLSLHAEIGGDLETDPSIFAQGALEDIHGGGLEDAFASLFFMHRQGHSLAQIQVDLGRGGSGAIGLEAYVDLTQRELEKALEEAYFDLSVDVLGFDLELAAPLVPEEVGEIRGTADGSLRFSGMIDALEIDARVEARGVRAYDLPALDYVLVAERKYGALTLDLATFDRTGLLAEARASTVGNALQMLLDPSTAAESLSLAPWLFRVRIPERRLDALPEKLLSDLPEALGEARFALSLEAQGGSLAPRIDAKGVFQVDQGTAALCGASRSFSVPFEIAIRDGDARLEGELLLGGRTLGAIRGGAEPELERAFTEGRFEPTPITLTLALAELRLGNVPLACEYVTGDLSGEIRFEQLMGATPRAMGYLESNTIRMRRDPTAAAGAMGPSSPPLSMGAAVRVDTERTTVDLTFRSGLDGRLRVDGTAPLALVPEGFTRLDEDGEFSLFLDVENAPLALLIGALPAFDNVEGVADGWGRFGGTLRAPSHHAELSIRDGRFTITALGQRVSDVEGVAVLDQDHLQLRHFRARDGDGGVSARGEMTLRDLSPDRARLDITLDGFPIRDEGAVVAALHGRGALEATFSANRADAKLTMRDLVVSLPRLGGPSIQGLADHPDIRIVGAVEEREGEDEPFVLRLQLDATEPFQVKGPDFDASVSADLLVDLTGDDLRIGGEVNLLGGVFSVLGKPFEVTSGSLRFDVRDETLSPAVSLEAVYLVDGNRNKRVTVSIGGTLSEPTVRFASNVPTQNEGEIISLIVTGEARSESDRGYDSAAAGRDAADFVAGVAFGVVSLSLREEFGGFLPVVTLEGKNRFRARFDAERFLPERVRRVVKRARIEGYFTAGQHGEEDQVRQTGQAQTSGFSVELGFPKGIVGRGTVAPPNNWSTQVLWEP